VVSRSRSEPLLVDDRLYGDRVKGGDFSGASYRQGHVLFNAMWMEPVSLVDGVIGTAADAVDCVAVGKLHDAVKARRF
jgi:hypothetical protein